MGTLSQNNRTANFATANIIKTILIDDYQIAIDNLKDLLSSFNDIEIIGEACNAKDGLHKIICTKPDLLFLDVEMPGQTGFDLINELIKAGSHLPKVIFTTAHGHYAIEALRIHAIDYLLKPVDYFELMMAIQRYKNGSHHQEEKRKLASLTQYKNKTKRILLPTITGLKQIPLGKVIFFQKENDATENVKIYYSANNIETILGNLSLKQIIDMLSEEDFFQTDRRTIINLDYLTNIETKTHTCILNKCDEVHHLPISRRRLKEFKNKCKA